VVLVGTDVGKRPRRKAIDSWAAGGPAGPASPEVERRGRAAPSFAELGDTQAGLGMLLQRVPSLPHGGIRAKGHRGLQANGEQPTSLHPAPRWIPRVLTHPLLHQPQPVPGFTPFRCGDIFVPCARCVLLQGVLGRSGKWPLGGLGPKYW